MSLEDRFWLKVNRQGPIVRDGLTPCWVWTGSTTSGGYGHLSTGHSTQVRAHRLSWELANGPIPDGQWVCHHCDNPPCVNPAHLFVGTRTDNVRDMHAKGRGPDSAVFGEKNGNSKLTADIVRDIRARHAAGTSQRSLARAVGVTKRTIVFIVRRVTWKHVA